MTQQNLRIGPMRFMKGVTLIELLIVVVIIGILSVIAIPSYRQYSIRTQRTEAKTALLRLAANQARFYLQNNTYTTNLAQLGFNVNSSEHGVYTIAVPVANANTFRATAVPAAGGGVNGVDMSSDAECALFQVTAQGARTATPDPHVKCW